jgi:methylmalonyl-CoA mutase N-terminal domain/subunit
MRIVRDTITFCARHLPRYNPINISGYHMSEAGANAVQEVAFTLANAIAYVEEVTRAGMDVDEFAARLSFYFVAQRDLFEEVAKMRAARRIWARTMRERFRAKRAESLRLRFHCQTAAATLTKAQPYNNVVRTTLQALAGVLGGAQSLHTNGLDEAYAIPTEFAMKLALRTQQVIADESGVADVVDPLGGSWYVEALTDEIERRAREYLERIDARGGMRRAIEDGFPQREIADSAYEVLRRKAAGDHVVVGVNAYADAGTELRIAVHRVDPEVERRKTAELRRIRARRDSALVEQRLAELVAAARDQAANLMPPTIAAVRARATMGEIVDALKVPFGLYRETPVF